MTTTTSPATGPAPLRETVRNNIRVEMARRSMSGPDLAAALDVAPYWVSRRLAGTIAIDLADLGMIAAALDTTPAQLVTETEEQS